MKERKENKLRLGLKKELVLLALLIIIFSSVNVHSLTHKITSGEP